MSATATGLLKATISLTHSSRYAPHGFVVLRVVFIHVGYPLIIFSLYPLAQFLAFLLPRGLSLAQLLVGCVTNSLC
jgi:hypothetical protein